MVESAPIVEYVGSSGYRTIGSIMFTVFTFVTIVVLMNMLIAQLSNTYTDIQVEAVKTVRANRAWIITRAERNEWKCCRNQLRRVRYYKRVYTDIDMRSLKRKDETQLDHISKAIKKIEKKQVKDALQTLTVKFRLSNFTNEIIHEVNRSHSSLRKQADDTGADIKSRVTHLETKVDNIENKIDTVTQQINEMRKLFDTLLLQKSSPE
ncbi:uncharacterized protein LOC128556019 [Mercenaria mercenaria]|uniref:uncharacterized protein LOC128556019 n=1 Tax=Mercenaria mercenaria TaxID=6596 RepID=UPI00234E67F2|nr:uncharacterized protein LOC128556019 [Mercenaria mercenaria]